MLILLRGGSGRQAVVVAWWWRPVSKVILTFMRRRIQVRREGQGLVEFALVLPILVLLLVGTIDMARWLDASHRLSRVASDGARFGAVKDSAGGAYPSRDDIREHIMAALPQNLRNAYVAINTAAAVGGEDAVSVRVSAALPCFTPGFNTGIVLTSESWFPRR